MISLMVIYLKYHLFNKLLLIKCYKKKQAISKIYKHFKIVKVRLLKGLVLLIKIKEE